MTKSEDPSGHYRESLESFRDLFNEYAEEVFGDHRRERLDELRARLQRLEPRVTSILLEVIGGGSYGMGYGGQIKRADLLPSALLGGNNEMHHNFGQFKATVSSSVERALGTLEAGLWAPREPTPILTIRDRELMDRCGIC